MINQTDEPKWEPLLSDGPLLAIPPMEFALLWGEILEAYHGVNGFGGNVAEIYSYRLQRYSPIVHSDRMKQGEHRDKEEWSHYHEAARALVSILEQFSCVYECKIEIDGVDPYTWVDTISCGDYRFDHRAHVTVTKSA